MLWGVVPLRILILMAFREGSFFRNWESNRQISNQISTYDLESRSEMKWGYVRVCDIFTEPLHFFSTVDIAFQSFEFRYSSNVTLFFYYICEDSTGTELNTECVSSTAPPRHLTLGNIQWSAERSLTIFPLRNLMPTVTESIVSETFAQREHEKYVAAVQSLLFMGNSSKDYVNPNSMSSTPLTFVKPSHSSGVIEERRLSESISEREHPLHRELNRIMTPLLDADSGHSSAIITDCLSSALISTSLVLASISKVKKRILPAGNSSDCIPAKRSRGNHPVTPPRSSRSALRNVADPESSLCLKSDAIKSVLSMSLKTQKSSADRYRERNSRRKQFFGRKLERVVELLKQYRLLQLEKVSTTIMICHLAHEAHFMTS